MEYRHHRYRRWPDALGLLGSTLSFPFTMPLLLLFLFLSLSCGGSGGGGGGCAGGCADAATLFSLLNHLHAGHFQTDLCY